MTKIYFISDFFLNEINGGAEHYNDVLISFLKNRYHDTEELHDRVIPVKSISVTADFLESNKECFFIIANFFQLSDEAVNVLMSKCQYAILEHDHKYSKTNNPSRFVNFMIPEEHVINKKFFANARAVLCQSKIHAEVVQKNLFLNNICCLGGNLWSEAQLGVLKKNMSAEKTIEHGIMHTHNKNKGMPFSIEYCKENDLEYEFLYNKPYEEFIKELSKVKKFVFFPQWLESYCRVAIEAKILGCKLITNGLIGASSEPYFSQSGEALLNTIRENNENIYNKWIEVIENGNIEYLPIIDVPKITILGTIYNGDEHIEQFIENIVNQTIFENCELILIDANSPGNEQQIIEKYLDKYDNIIYKRLDYRATTSEALNIGIDMSTGEFLTFGLIDDRRKDDCFEILSKHLMFNPQIDLVYGDCYETDAPNSNFEDFMEGSPLYGHSIEKFSKYNMIRCLPGPMPMWRKSMNKKHGHFDVNIDFADDWEMWLRAVDGGSKFKKVGIPIGVYLSGGRSQTGELNLKQRREESTLFFKYSHIFGKNFELYKEYFSQFRS